MAFWMRSRVAAFKRPALSLQAAPVFQNNCFHPFCDHIGNRGKDKAQKRQLPVIGEKHENIGKQCYACVKNLCCKFPYSFRTCVYIG